MSNKDCVIETKLKEIVKNENIKTRSLCQEDILKCVSEFYNISPELILSKTRKREVVEPRQILCHFLKKYIKTGKQYNSKLSLEKIGNFVSQKYSTVIYSLKVVSNLSETNSDYKEKLSKIEKLIFVFMPANEEKNINLTEFVDAIPGAGGWKNKINRETYLKYSYHLFSKDIQKDEIVKILENLFYAAKNEQYA